MSQLKKEWKFEKNSRSSWSRRGRDPWSSRRSQKKVPRLDCKTGWTWTHFYNTYLFCVHEFLYNQIRRHKSPRACSLTLILFFPLCCVECNISFFCAIYPLNQNTFGTYQGASSLCFSNPHWLWGGNIKINSSFGYNTVLTQDASLPQVKVPVTSKWKS